MHELKERNSLTPNEPIFCLESKVHPEALVEGWEHHGTLESVTIGNIEALPVGAFIETAITPESAQAWRRTGMTDADTLGGDLAVIPVGSHMDKLIVRIMKLPLGAYYAAAYNDTAELLDAMEEGVLHYVAFQTMDNLQLFWMLAKRWEESRAAAIRTMATYEGRLNTIQVRRIPEDQQTENERKRVAKARNRKEASVVKGGRLERPTKPWQKMNPGQTVTLPAEEISSMRSLRSTLSQYGRRTSQKFSVSALSDGSAEITRKE